MSQYTAPFPIETPRLGDRVRIERDEVRHPSRGTWPRFRGRTGVVVEINADRKHPHLTEYGIVFGRVAPRIDGRGGFHWSSAEPTTWFKAHEVRPVIGGEAAQRPATAVPIRRRLLVGATR